MTPETSLLQARLKLSFARMLKADLDRGADFINNFNCARADSSIIVGGCSEKVWQQNYDKLLGEVRELMGVEAGSLEELGELAQSGAK